MKRVIHLCLVMCVMLFVGIGSASIGFCSNEPADSIEYEWVDGNGVVTKGTANITVNSNNAATETPQFKPVYCIANKLIPSFYYTVDASMKKTLIEQYSTYWQDCGTGFYASDTATSQLKPVYCIANKQMPSFYYTTDENMKKLLVEQYSTYWQDYGVAFYASDTATSQLKAVYCIANKQIPSFYYTTDENMKKLLVEQYSTYWQDCGTAFYGCDTATGCTTPTVGACTNGNVTDGTYEGTTSGNISLTTSSNKVTALKLVMYASAPCTGTVTLTLASGKSFPISSCSFDASGSGSDFTLSLTGKFSSTDPTASGSASYKQISNGCTASSNWKATKK
ncbi:MAG: hypothetical protein HQL06_04965 [Nitrospirae bacterium]|nr:hypothetical protein [Nitrospirota bacterium]